MSQSQVTQDIVEDEETPGMPVRSRQGRTTPAQFDFYIDFIAKNPNILNSSERNYNRLWEELTAELNTRGPSLPMKEWQGRLRNWQYQLIGKQKRNVKLSPRDIRALNLIGKIKVTGSSLVPEINISDASDSETSQAVQETEAEQAQDNIEVEEVLLPAPKRRRVNRGDTVDRLVELMEDQAKRDQERKEAEAERLKIDALNAESMRILAESSSGISTAITTFANAFTKN